MKDAKICLSIVCYKINASEVIAGVLLGEFLVVYFVSFSWTELQVFVNFKYVCGSSTLLWWLLFFLLCFALLNYSWNNCILESVNENNNIQVNKTYLAVPVSAWNFSYFRFVAVSVECCLASIADNHVLAIGLLFTFLASNILDTLRPVDAFFEMDQVEH